MRKDDIQTIRISTSRIPAKKWCLKFMRHLYHRRISGIYYYVKYDFIFFSAPAEIVRPTLEYGGLAGKYKRVTTYTIDIGTAYRYFILLCMHS